MANVTKDPQLDTAKAADMSNRSQPRQARIQQMIANLGVVLFLFVLCGVFSIAEPGLFPTLSNFQTIAQNQSVPAILAIAVILPLAAGEFDLSVGATLGIVNVMTAWLSVHGWPTGVVVVAGIALGAAIGGVNAFLVGRVGVSAFIATLGMATVLGGANLWVSGGQVLFSGISKELVTIANTSVLGLPAVFYYLLAVAIAIWVLLEWTPYGRYLTATGLGRVQARLAGVSTSRYLAEAFVLSGALSGLAGVLYTGAVGSANPATGPEFLLPAYAAAFLGATTIRRGRFNVWGTMVGVLVLSVGISGLNLAGAPFWVSPVFNGGALLVAVSLAAIFERRGTAGEGSL